MKKFLLFISFIFLINSKSQAQFNGQSAIYDDHSFISLKNIEEIHSIAEKSYLKLNTFPDKTEEFYLRRSKNYRIVGWSTLIGGIVLSGAGLLIGSSSNYNSASSTSAGVLVVAGAVSGIVSIPFMIMATGYKHKARVMVDNQKTGFGIPSNISKDITGITFRISIGK
ncbi:MAG: hypothetical protein IPL54_03395 [Chitinophagaceae bacterium]|nr:hypothetical protein [Chitinophagaceae bacterium]